MPRLLYDITDARRILNPGPVAIVTTAWRGATNAAPVAWTTPLSIEPPLIGCVIHPHRHTADMIRFTEEFALNIPGPSLLKQTAFLGSQSGLQHAKLEASGVETFNALRIDAPLIEGCLAWIECGLEDVLRVGDHTLFVGRVVTVQALEEAYETAWKLADPALSPLAYLGGTRYAPLGEPLEASFEVDELGALVAENAEEREARQEREALEAERRRAEGPEGVEQMRREGFEA